MHCLECGAEVPVLDNAHLLACSGLTLQEYALRRRLPLELLVPPQLLDRPDSPEAYPEAGRSPSERERAVLEGLRMAGRLANQGVFACIEGDVRRLDLLLWDLEHLRHYGFLFRQEYSFDPDAHRVVARNVLKTPRRNLMSACAPAPSLAPPPDFRLALAVCVAHAAELQAGYLFLPLPRAADAEEVKTFLARGHGIEMMCLPREDSSALLRTRTRSDTQALLRLLGSCLADMPGAPERFRDEGPEVTVCKELVFDSAHFITDHPAKCANLHGGRYVLQVKVRGRIDPATGCVIDYGYLKRVAEARIIRRFDHHHLNYAAPELAWRSSTEVLCVYIWEQLIDYLPGLDELFLHETPQSGCSYRGPSLEEFQAQGPSTLIRHFQDPQLGRDRRARLAKGDPTLVLAS